jgi:hypothetical protein
MLLAVSAPSSTLRRSDLGCAKQMRFCVAVRDKGAADVAQVRARACAHGQDVLLLRC